MKNGDMPAMPIELDGFGLYEPCTYLGLTKREQFAMAAMQGILNNHTYTFADCATDAVQYADALLTELERTK